MSSSLIGNKADCDIVALCGSKPRSRRADPTASTGYENERRLLASALARSGGNQSVAARLLGITRDKLRYQMKKFAIKPNNG